MIRPELRAAFARWREAIIGGAVAALGLYWVLGGGLLRIVGLAVLVLGVSLLVSGIQRGRFRQGSGGAGVVELVEGQLGYFGPQTGGVMAVADIRRVSRNGDLWVLEGGGTRLEIPADAAGAECLLDAFAMLPGLDLNAIVASVDKRTDSPRLLWQRGPRRLS